MHRKRVWSLGLVVLAGLVLGLIQGASAQSAQRYFPETGQWLRGRFLQYWESHGGLAQQGYPLTDEFPEPSAGGKTYTVQYFERAVFEYHPENAGTPYEVLLSLVGDEAYQAKYPQGASNQRPHPDGRLFPETGKRLGGSFRTYWESHGGLPQQGYPISDEFTEVSALDGQPYTVQYFERAVFEYHPEHKGTPFEVLLAQLGTYRHQARYQGQDLSLPGPLPGRVQRNPQGSADRYVVWSEAPTGTVPAGTILRGFDLTARRALTITTNAGDYPSYGISGSIVVWDEQAVGCTPNCSQGNIRGLDLATNQAFAIATGPGLRFGPAISGRTVAWVEIHNATAQLLVKDLGAPTATLVTTSTYESSPYFYEGFGALQISPQYVVWTLVSSRSAGSNTYHYATLRAYNRQTGTIQDVAAYGGGPYDQGPRLRGYALDGEQLFWFADGLQLANLRTGERRQVFGPPAGYGDAEAFLGGVRGNVVYWLAGPLVNGWRLDQPGVVNLVSDPGLTAQATIAGEWLVWNTCTSYEPSGCGALRVAPLDRLFAANHPLPTYAPPPPSATPTPPPPTPTLEPPLPTAGPGGPAIPTPRPGDSQFNPAGSANYLVWNEVMNSSSPPNVQLRALNVATGQVTTLATGLDASPPRMDGSVVIWSDSAQGQIIAQDLARNQRYTLQPGPSWRGGMALSGREVVWVEQVVEGEHLISRIFKQTLGTTTPQIVVTLTGTPADDHVIGAIALSPAVLAWSEEQMSGPALVRAQDRRTGSISTVATLQLDQHVYDLVVDDTTIAWTNPLVSAVDLREPARPMRTLSDAPADQLRASNGILVWTGDRPTLTGIWGRRLPAGPLRRLTAGSNPALAGPWLVYSQDQRLQVVRWTDRLP